MPTVELDRDKVQLVNNPAPPNPNQPGTPQPEFYEFLRQNIFRPQEIRFVAGSSDNKFINPSVTQFDRQELSQAIMSANVNTLLDPLVAISKEDRDQRWKNSDDTKDLSDGKKSKKWHDEMVEYVKGLEQDGNTEALDVLRDNFGLKTNYVGHRKEILFRMQLEKLRKNYAPKTDSVVDYKKSMVAFLETFTQDIDNLPALIRRFDKAGGIIGILGGDDTIILLKTYFLSHSLVSRELSGILVYGADAISKPLDNETQHAFERFWSKLNGGTNAPNPPGATVDQQNQTQQNPQDQQANQQPQNQQNQTQVNQHPAQATHPHNAPIAPVVYGIDPLYPQKPEEEGPPPPPRRGGLVTHDDEDDIFLV